METQSASERKYTMWNVLYLGSVFHFLCCCVILHDECNQAHIVKDTFNLDINVLRAQKDQMEHPMVTTPINPPTLPRVPPLHGGQMENSTVTPHNPPASERVTRGYLNLQHHAPDSSMGASVNPTPSDTAPSTSSQTAQHQHQPPLKKRKTVMTSNKQLYCSFILKDDFNAGDSNLRSPEYTAFVTKIEHGLRVTLQEYTKKLLKVLTMCISQLKRMVFMKIECSEGLTEGEIKQALLSAKYQLTKSSLRICRGTLLFRDRIPAVLAADIIQRRHIEDSFGRRIDFNTQYVRLKILSPKALAAVKRDELERPDKYQQALQESSGKDITDEDIILPGDVVKYVLVRGRAGIGKSTLVQRLMWRWAHGEWATHFKAIFLISLRHLMAMKTCMDLPDILSRFAVYSLGQHDITLEAGWLQENQLEVAFIVDGIDEMLNFREEWKKTHTQMSLRMEAPGLSWAFLLMKRMCLPDSTIIVTSRPFSDLCCIKPTMMVEVMGLTKERVFEFVEKNVEPQRVKMVKETLVNQPILLSVSSISFYCAALCSVLQDDIGVTKLTTYTQITAYIMERFIYHSVKTLDANETDLSSGLQAMTTLAYTGLMKSSVGGLAQLVFDKGDLRRQKIKQEDVDMARRSGMFMQTNVPGTSGNKHILGEFVHLSIQEFLAMIGLLMQSPAEVKTTLKMMSSSGQFNMALLFLYGFAFNRSSEAVKRLCAAIGLKLDIGDEIRKILANYIKSHGAKLQVLQMVHESQSAEVAQLVGQHRFKHEVKVSKTKMTVVDMLALIFMLKNHHSATDIVLEHVALDAFSMKELCEFLKYNNTVTSLRIQDRGLDDECLQLLTEALRVNQVITHLHLDVGLNLDSMKKVSKCLKSNSTITQVT